MIKYEKYKILTNILSELYYARRKGYLTPGSAESQGNEEVPTMLQDTRH